jgi:hypothetical protein
LARPSENYEFGGVDSKSNPFALPNNRSLLCRNFVPNPGGWLELRRGYQLVKNIGTAIHSIADYQTLDSNGLPVRWLMIGAGTGVWSLKLSDLTLTQVGTLPSADKWGVFYANGQIHIGTKKGVWFWDGIKFRKSGIRSLTSSEAARINVNLGVSIPDTSAVTVAASAGGAWSRNDTVGRYVYAAVWDPGNGTISPSVLLNSAQIAGSTGQKLVASNLPALSGAKVWVLLVTTDGGSQPWYLSARGSGGVITYLPFTSFTVSGRTVTVNSIGHGLSTGAPVRIAYGVGITAASFGPVPIVVLDANRYSFVVPSGSALPLAGSIYTAPILTGNTIANDLLGLTFAANAGFVGLPASSVQSAQPGYQLYACLYNPTTQHAGNRVPIGKRLVPASPSSAVIDLLPDLSAEDPEWQVLIGSTVDGGEVPYALMDGQGNWLTASAAQTQITFGGDYSLDFESELPSRNGVPLPMDRFCTIGDWVLGGTGTDTWVHISGSAASSLNPIVIGRPEQSWAPDDVTMFPFREIPLNIWENGNDAICQGESGMARLVYAQGIWDWADTFPMGVAGQRAFTQSDHGPHWVNYKKKLATIGSNGPVEISGEYERALLSRIGDAYMNDVTLMHLHNVDKYQDQIVIKARDKNGLPFEVIHDFNLSGQATYSLGETASGKRTYEAGESTSGQGYVREYAGALAADYVMADCKDVHGFKRAFYGGSDGNLYLGQEGWNDNGSEYTADLIGLSNVGPNRPSIFDVSLWGDPDILNQNVFSWRTDLNGSGDWKQPDPADDVLEAGVRYHHRFDSGPLHMFYYRFHMNSHSADAPATELSDPPHLPLETYGKIYMARALYSDVEEGTN